MKLLKAKKNIKSLYSLQDCEFMTINDTFTKNLPNNFIYFAQSLNSVGQIFGGRMLPNFLPISHYRLVFSLAPIFGSNLIAMYFEAWIERSHRFQSNKKDIWIFYLVSIVWKGWIECWKNTTLFQKPTYGVNPCPMVRKHCWFHKKRPKILFCGNPLKTL